MAWQRKMQHVILGLKFTDKFSNYLAVIALHYFHVG